MRRVSILMMAGLLSLAAFRIASPAASKAEDDF